MFSPRSDGTIPFCVNIKRMNAVLKSNSVTITHTDESINSLEKFMIIPALNTKSGYGQVGTDDRDKGKTNFIKHCETYGIITMPLGLKNGPSTLHRASDITLALVKCHTALVCLDYLVLYSETLEEHISHIEQGLTILKIADVTLKL